MKIYLTVDPKLEEFKLGELPEESFQLYVPQTNSSEEKSVWVEILTEYEDNEEGLIRCKGMVGISCKGLNLWSWGSSEHLKRK